jgi:hypothetical protein
VPVEFEIDCATGGKRHTWVDGDDDDDDGENSEFCAHSVNQADSESRMVFGIQHSHIHVHPKTRAAGRQRHTTGPPTPSYIMTHNLKLARSSLQVECCGRCRTVSFVLDLFVAFRVSNDKKAGDPSFSGNTSCCRAGTLAKWSILVCPVFHMQ